MTLQLKRWHRDAYNALAGTAALTEGERVELIEGDIVAMSPQGPLHGNTVMLLQELLFRSYGATHFVRVQSPLNLNEWSQPEPDLALVSRAGLDLADHPQYADLIVEVSVTSLDYDLGNKASVYAKAGLPEVWILDLEAPRLIVLRQPALDPAAPYGFSYAWRQHLTGDDVVAALFQPTTHLTAAQLIRPSTGTPDLL